MRVHVRLEGKHARRQAAQHVEDARLARQDRRPRGQMRARPFGHLRERPKVRSVARERAPTLLHGCARARFGASGSQGAHGRKGQRRTGDGAGQGRRDPAEADFPQKAGAVDVEDRVQRQRETIPRPDLRPQQDEAGVEGKEQLGGSDLLPHGPRPPRQSETHHEHAEQGSGEGTRLGDPSGQVDAHVCPQIRDRAPQQPERAHAAQQRGVRVHEPELLDIPVLAEGAIAQPPERDRHSPHNGCRRERAPPSAHDEPCSESHEQRQPGGAREVCKSRRADAQRHPARAGLGGARSRAGGGLVGPLQRVEREHREEEEGGVRENPVAVVDQR